MILYIIVIIIIFISLFGLYYIFYKNTNNNKIKKKITFINKKTQISNLEEEEEEEEEEREILNLDDNKHFEFNILNVDNYNYDSKLCKYKDDTGLICPLHYKNISNEEIKPFQECSIVIKDKVCSYILKEWSKETKVNNIDEAYSYVISNWAGGDIFYVLYNDDKLIGFIAVDRKQFYPYISHLYVIEEERKKGYGKILINFSIEYINKLQFNEARLWCEPLLVPYYTKIGWKILEKQKDKIIMIFTIKEIS